MTDSQIIFKKVLVAEDSAINQIFIQRSLSKIAESIDVAENGAQAVEMVKNNVYDIILMDIFMPEMDGYEATCVIRNKLHVDTPIIAVSSISLPGEEQKCIDAGMNGYIVKPFNADVMKKLVEEKGFATTGSSGDVSNKHIYKGVTINLDILFQLGEDTYEHLITMIELFTDNMEKTIVTMKEQADKNEWDTLQKTAHYAKSSLSVVQVNEMYELAREIDYNCKGEVNLDSLSGKVLKFEQLFMSAKEFLDNYVAELKKGNVIHSYKS